MQTRISEKLEPCNTSLLMYYCNTSNQCWNLDSDKENECFKPESFFPSLYIVKISLPQSGPRLDREQGLRHQTVRPHHLNLLDLVA